MLSIYASHLLTDPLIPCRLPLSGCFGFGYTLILSLNGIDVMNIVGCIVSIENMSRGHTYNVKLKGKLNKEDNTM